LFEINGLKEKLGRQEGDAFPTRRARPPCVKLSFTRARVRSLESVTGDLRIAEQKQNASR
jgi:hypothetical protein